MNNAMGRRKDKKESGPSKLPGGRLPLLLLIMIIEAGQALPAETLSPGARPSSRVVTVKIAAEERLGINPAWKKDIKKLIGNSSETFKDKFGIEFWIMNWRSWRPEKHLDSLRAFLEDLKRKVPPGEADIVVGVFAPFSADDAPAGITDYFNGSVLLKLANPWAMLPVVLHELGHVFGTVDLEENGSVMDPRNPGLSSTRSQPVSSP